MIKYLLQLSKETVKNFFFQKKHDFLFISENFDWAIYWFGKYIVDILEKKRVLRGLVTISPYGIRNKIIHFGSVNTFLTPRGFRNIHPSNSIVLTWFHIVPGDRRIIAIPDLNEKVNVVHTASQNTKQLLISHGLNEDKIIVIPLGIDLSLFKPCLPETKRSIREKIGISDETILIGSFQKDGEGWDKGLKPKLIKGPDIFCQAVRKIHQDIKNIHVLLTGPSRGYVKNELRKMQIPFTHVYLEKYPDIVQYYQSLDLYLMCSREEGGPNALLECMATRTPLISTPVGMVKDLVVPKVNGLVAEMENPRDIAQQALNILKDETFRQEILDNGFKTAQEYSMEKVVMRFNSEIYSILMK